VKLIRSLAAVTDDLRNGAVAIGNFDGVHLGHARIVRRLVELARQAGGPALVFTFDPHPVRLLRPALAPPPLTWTDRKAALLAEQGADAILAYPTDEALLRLSAREFFDQIVVAALEARAIVEGASFHFGHDREGNVDVLRAFAEAAGILLEVVPPVQRDGKIVSSSLVRQLLAEGDVARARELLTHPYRIRGMVIHGVGRGARIGFPTANVDAIDTILPAQGVYAGRAMVDDDAWPAAINIGPNPTFGERALKIEAHLAGFANSLYGQPLEVEFLARLRGVGDFGGVDALRAQLARDVAATVEICSRLES
jgi:riboflavin kinase/FMN adenylyltransferase